MKTLAETPAHLLSLVLLAEPFVAATTAGQTVAFVDDGRQNVAEETAFREAGFFARVLPPLEAKTVSQGAGRGVVDVGLAVRLAVNPGWTNSAGENAPADIWTLIQNVKAQVLGWDPPAVERERYQLGETALSLDLSDPGQLAYLLFFQKRCAF